MSNKSREGDSTTLLMREQLQAINVMIQQQGWIMYRQYEALVPLYTMLHPRMPLPPLRGWAVSPDFALLIVNEIWRSKPNIVIELGSGSSTIIAAYALEKLSHGKIISIEHEKTFSKKTETLVADHGLEDFTQVVYTPLVSQLCDGKNYRWYDLSQVSLPASIDLLIVDGPPTEIQADVRYPALEKLYDRLSDDAVILIDDAARPDEKQIIAQWCERYSDFKVEKKDCEKGAVVLRRRT